MSRSSRKCARSAPCVFSTESMDSSHSWVSAGSRSSSFGSSVISLLGCASAAANGRTSGCRMSLLPTCETPRITRVRGPLHARAANQLDAMLVDRARWRARAKSLARLPRRAALAGAARAAQAARWHGAQHDARQQPADARRARLSASGSHAFRAPRARGPHAQGGGRRAPHGDRACSSRRRSPPRSKRCSRPLSRRRSHSRPFARSRRDARASSASSLSGDERPGRRARGRHGARQQSRALAHRAAAEQAGCGGYRASSPSWRGVTA